MNKFGKPTDEEYLTVCDIVIDMVKAPPGRVNELLERPFRSDDIPLPHKKINLHNFLLDPMTSANHGHLGSHSMIAGGDLQLSGRSKAVAADRARFASARGFIGSQHDVKKGPYCKLSCQICS